MGSLPAINDIELSKLAETHCFLGVVRVVALSFNKFEYSRGVDPATIAFVSCWGVEGDCKLKVEFLLYISVTVHLANN